MKKIIYLLSIIAVFSSCINTKGAKKDDIYLLFLKNKSMKTKYVASSSITKKPIGSLRYLYKLENGNILFETNTSKRDSFKIKFSESKKYNIKDINWLSKNTNKGLDYYAVKFLINKNIYIVKTDSVEKLIKVIPVHFIQEIE
jgi:hypothetical protein